MKIWGKYGTLGTGAYLAASDPTTAAEQVDRALPCVLRHELRGHLPALLRLRSEARSRQAEGDLAGAVLDAEEALAQAVNLGMAPEVARCRLQLGYLYGRLGKGQEAEGYLRAARTELAALGMRFLPSTPRANRLPAEYATEGDIDPNNIQIERA